jgi:hypothetical protein
MTTRHIKIAAVVSILFWLGCLAHQVYWLFTVYEATAENPEMADFIRSFLGDYGVSSSLQTLITVGVGVALSILVFIRPSQWAALGLSALALVVFWLTFLSGISFHFHPPRGDGSMHAAMLSWWRLHSPMIVVHAIKFIFLVASVVFWILALRTVRLYEEKPAA